MTAFHIRTVEHDLIAQVRVDMLVPVFKKLHILEKRNLHLKFDALTFHI
jgi:hypothetical protein